MYVSINQCELYFYSVAYWLQPWYNIHPEHTPSNSVPDLDPNCLIKNISLSGAGFIKLLYYLSENFKCIFLIYFQLCINETLYAYEKTTFFISMQSFIEVVRVKIEKSAYLVAIQKTQLCVGINHNYGKATNNTDKLYIITSKITHYTYNTNP